mmetsp:Transcript_73657/g.216106  ORF Transcript_73657/g.216106 Transcript_73657/m.216106 type:complete len:283 (-) Transcript_73657:1004-1852(-)
MSPSRAQYSGSTSRLDDTRCSKYPSAMASWPCNSCRTSSAVSGQRGGPPGSGGPAKTGSTAAGSIFRSSGTYCRSSSAPPGWAEAAFKALHISDTIWGFEMCKLFAASVAARSPPSIPRSREPHSRSTSSYMPCSFHRRASTSMRFFPRRRPSQSPTAHRTPVSISSCRRWSSWSISTRSFRSTVSTACSSGPGSPSPGERWSAGRRSSASSAPRCRSRKLARPALARSALAETAESEAPSEGRLSSSLSRTKSRIVPAKLIPPSLAELGGIQASGSNWAGR